MPVAQSGVKRQLPKVPTGITGFDEITHGGLPRGRPTLVCGGPGCGKTLFAMEFLVRGAMQYGEPGVFMAFEETPQELADNIASLGFDLQKLQARKQLVIDYVRVERSEIEEAGNYDLQGLFLRLQDAIDRVSAKRVVLDTIESLFGALSNPSVLRSELRRLFRWLKDRGLTVVLTGEQGAGALTRQGLEEYVSDCVILLDHRVDEEQSTRRLRIVKYRGALHEPNECPFLIDENGISILPLSMLRLDHEVSELRMSTGIARLDAMLGGHGYFKGSTVLISGTAGTGKTSLAATMAACACERGEKCLYVSFEESPAQLLRNMRSVGIGLQSHIDSGRFQIQAHRPGSRGLELHLVELHKTLAASNPALVVMDPITALVGSGTAQQTHSVLTRLIDFMKVRGATAILTSLTGDADVQASGMAVSSLIDTWIALQMVRSGGERNRVVSIIKSRGMAHSKQTSEYMLTASGIVLADTYLGPGDVLTGSARLTKQADDDAAFVAGAQEIARRQQERERHRNAFERHIAELREQFEAEDSALDQSIMELTARRNRILAGRSAMAVSRQAFEPAAEAARPRSQERRR